MSLVQFLKNTFAVLLAILVIISTTSFALSTHFCGSKLVSYSATSQAKPCCKMAKNKIFNQTGSSNKSFKCCKDKKIDKDSEDHILGTITNAKIQLQSILLLLPQLDLINNYVFQENEITSSLVVCKNSKYKEQPTSINILHQVFLI